jgi:hypothetical protein
MSTVNKACAVTSLIITGEEFVAQTRQTEWGRSADGIVVQLYDHLGKEIAKYHVDGGEWRCISGNIDNIPELPHDDIPF